MKTNEGTLKYLEEYEEKCKKENGGMQQNEHSYSHYPSSGPFGYIGRVKNPYRNRRGYAGGW